jgi:hypothetical protein
MKTNPLVRLSSLLLTLVACLLLGFVLPARAQTSMTVVNQGFETGTLTGWSVVSSGGYGSGASVVNNVADQQEEYPNFPNPLPGTAAGTYYAAVSGYDGHPAEEIYQDISANGQGNGPLQPNTTYTLTVAIGEGLYSTPNPGFISLVNGTSPSGTVLATTSLSGLFSGNYADTFKDATVTFTTGATVSGDLTIVIGTAYGYNTASFMGVDNVRLTQQSVGQLPLVNFSIANSGFESGNLTGWSVINSGGYGSGASVVDNTTNQSQQYPNYPATLPGTASGTYYAQVAGYDGNPAEVIYQDVTANGLGNAGLQPNTTYNVLVAIGVGKYSSSVNNAFVELINGTSPTGTVLATANVSSLGMGAYAGTFRDLLLTFTTGATASGDITIAIGTPYGYSAYGPIDLDNVRLTSQGVQTNTIGTGSLTNPAIGPAPSYGIGGSGFTLVKNWVFGTAGTITSDTDLKNNFQFHDQFNQYMNPNYGAASIAPDSADALSGQPYQGETFNGVTVPAARSYSTNYMRTYVVPLTNATNVTAANESTGGINVGSGAFTSKWTLPTAGSLYGHDIIWETRVRYVTPPYFWFALWDDSYPWDYGAEMDLIESYGYNQNGTTNYAGAYWHSNTVVDTAKSPATDQVNFSSWGAGMKAAGISTYDATQYHIWTLAYYKDNTYALYVDGTKVQYGSNYWWNQGGYNPGLGGETNVYFHFDATWGSTTVSGDDPNSAGGLAASALSNTYYEFAYSRVYVR